MIISKQYSNFKRQKTSGILQRKKNEKENRKLKMVKRSYKKYSMIPLMSNFIIVC